MVPEFGDRRRLGLRLPPSLPGVVVRFAGVTLIAVPAPLQGRSWKTVLPSSRHLNISALAGKAIKHVKLTANAILIIVSPLSRCSFSIERSFLPWSWHALMTDAVPYTGSFRPDSGGDNAATVRSQPALGLHHINEQDAGQHHPTGGIRIQRLIDTNPKQPLGRHCTTCSACRTPPDCRLNVPSKIVPLLHSRPASTQRGLQIGCHRLEQANHRLDLLRSGTSPERPSEDV